MPDLSRKYLCRFVIAVAAAGFPAALSLGATTQSPVSALGDVAPIAAERLVRIGGADLLVQVTGYVGAGGPATRVDSVIVAIRPTDGTPVPIGIRATHLRLERARAGRIYSGGLIPGATTAIAPGFLAFNVERGPNWGQGTRANAIVRIRYEGQVYRIEVGTLRFGSPS